jgi:hypothetical protein
VRSLKESKLEEGKIGAVYEVTLLISEAKVLEDKRKF